MRVCFDVHGVDEAELMDRASAELSRFAGARRWHVDIEAHAEVMAVDGAVTLWRGEVTAEHDDREAP